MHNNVESVHKYNQLIDKTAEKTARSADRKQIEAIAPRTALVLGANQARAVGALSNWEPTKNPYRTEVQWFYCSSHVHTLHANYSTLCLPGNLLDCLVSLRSKYKIMVSTKVILSTYNLNLKPLLWKYMYLTFPISFIISKMYIEYFSVMFDMQFLLNRTPKSQVN